MTFRGITSLNRFQQEDWRSPIFLDMILQDVKRLGPRITLLDIGCGSGFDGDQNLQKNLAACVGRYIGVEPDTSISPPEICQEYFSCGFENAPIIPSSIHVAFAIFVLEHLTYPERFWNKFLETLVDGGVFWGFPVDKRSFYAIASQFSERFKFKNWYLNVMLGKIGERYQNYPTYYRANSPRQIRKQTGSFRKSDFLSLHRLGQLDCVIPRKMRFISRILDRFSLCAGLPGTNLVVRLEK